MFPKHVLIIPDGNRRWAKKNRKSFDSTYRYALSTITTRLIEYILTKTETNILSIYIISKKNIEKREKKEVKPILDNEIKVFKKWGNNKNFVKHKIKFKFIGDLNLFPKNYVKAAKKLETSTKSNKKKLCNLLAGYDAETELIEIINKIMQTKRKTKIKKIMPKFGIKEPIDLLIRTGGEQRLSGAPLIQISYSELFFTKKLYPDLSPKIIKQIFKKFEKIERRYGK